MRLLPLLPLAALSLLLAGGCGGKASKDPNAANRAVLDKQMERQDALKAAEMLDTLPEVEMTATTHEEMGDHYYRKGNLMLAYLQYTKALRFDPESTILRYKLGKLFLRRGMPEEAKEEFLFVLKEEEHPNVFRGLGQARLMLGDLEGAEKDLQRCLELDAEQWQARNLLGVLYNRTRRYEKAREQFETALLNKPDAGLLYNNLGITFLATENYEQAIHAFSKALQLGSIEKRTYNNLAVAFAKAGRYEDALESFKRGSGPAAAYNNLGYFYSLEGEYDKAAEALKKAVELSPSYYHKAQENLENVENLLQE
ncbi:tetratricopeptide repeat protein [Candidatus Moduliflexota bacterium]